MKEPIIQGAIKQIITPAVKMVAVYAGDDDYELWRNDVIYLALWDDMRERDPKFRSSVTPCNIPRDGFGEGACEDADNFLGYEFDGEKVDWSTELSNYRKENEKRKSGKEGQMTNHQNRKEA